jgi:hypothetical protein
LRRLLAFALVIGLLWPLWALVSMVFPSPLPKEFGRLKVAYASERSFGFGPGGNETGIVVYDLPADLAAAVARGGVSYLASLDTSRSPLDGWIETPIALDGRWRPDDGGVVEPHAPPGIGGFLFRYGWEVPLDPKVEAEVNGALFSPGSYLAYGRNGLMLISPGRRIVVRAYRK